MGRKSIRMGYKIQKDMTRSEFEAQNEYNAAGFRRFVKFMILATVIGLILIMLI